MILIMTFNNWINVRIAKSFQFLQKISLNASFSELFSSRKINKISVMTDQSHNFEILVKLVYTNSTSSASRKRNCSSAVRVQAWQLHNLSKGWEFLPAQLPKNNRKFARSILGTQTAQYCRPKHKFEEFWVLYG